MQPAMQSSADLPFRPMPLRPAWIRAGSPEATGTVAVKSPDGKHIAGLWECTAGTFDFNFEYHESAYILAGEAVVTDEHGHVHRLVPGVTVHFPEGLKTTWVVETFIRKVYFALEGEDG